MNSNVLQFLFLPGNCNAHFRDSDTALAQLLSENNIAINIVPDLFRFRDVRWSNLMPEIGYSNYVFFVVLFYHLTGKVWDSA
jgi:hypothetical protein